MWCYETSVKRLALIHPFAFIPNENGRNQGEPSLPLAIPGLGEIDYVLLHWDWQQLLNKA